jgi:hypothetical protein
MPTASLKPLNPASVILWLWIAWSIGAVISAVSGYGLISRFVAGTLILYAGAGSILYAALKRDNGLVTLKGLLVSRAGAAFTIVGFVLVQTLFSLSEFRFAAAANTFAAGIFFTMWLTAHDARTLSLRCARVLLAGSAAGICAFSGEILLRIPSVTHYFVPHTYVIENEWGDKDYEPGTFTTLLRGRKFRSRHLDTPKTAGVQRIVVLGDSFSWGHRIHGLDDCWPYVMERAVGAQGIPNQVLNLAHAGDTTVNELEYLQKFGWDLQPDIVVLQYFLNDPLPSGPDFQRVYDAQWKKAPVHPLAVSHNLHRHLNQSSYLYSELHVVWCDAVRWLFNLKNLSDLDLHRDGTQPWRDAKEAIRQIARECRERETPLLMVMFPRLENRTRLDESYRYISLHEKLRSLAESEEIAFLDMLSVYAAENPSANSWRVHPSDGHPSIKAHQLAGQVIASRLVELRHIREILLSKD